MRACRGRRSPVAEKLATEYVFTSEQELVAAGWRWVAADPDAIKAIDAALVEARAGRATSAPIEISFGADKQFTRRLYVNPTRESLGPGEIAILYAIDATE